MRQANPPPLTAMRTFYDYGITVTLRRGLHVPEIRRNGGSGNLRDPCPRQREGGGGLIVSGQGSGNTVEHPATLHHEHVKSDGSLFLPVK